MIRMGNSIRHKRVKLVLGVLIRSSTQKKSRTEVLVNFVLEF